MHEFTAVCDSTPVHGSTAVHRSTPMCAVHGSTAVCGSTLHGSTSVHNRSTPVCNSRWNRCSRLLKFMEVCAHVVKMQERPTCKVKKINNGIPTPQRLHARTMYTISKKLTSTCG